MHYFNSQSLILLESENDKLRINIFSMLRGQFYAHVFSFIRAVGTLLPLFPALVFDISVVLCCTLADLCTEKNEK